ncbi:MAG TPA: alpha/beta hydrolase [Amycolatopsis sp.]|nr:alpha/beta hydrolase [Amycolatopsis sp.]
MYEDDYLYPWEQPVPVILEHGFSRNGIFWRKWIPLLAGERRVYRPDVRGFGQSSLMPDDYKWNVDDMISDIVAILDHFDLKEVHWVGESSGGTLGIGLAATHPERVKSLVLMDAPAHPYGDPTTGEDNAMDQGSVQEAILKYGLEEWCRTTLWRRLDLEKSSPELQNWYNVQTGLNSDKSAAGWSDINTQLDLRPMLSKITAPTLILAGEKSPIVGKQQKYMADNINGARLHMFEGFGHGLSLIAAQECVAEIKGFWKSVEDAD